MSTILDAAEFGRVAVRLGLMTDFQLAECLDELGNTDAVTLAAALERKQYLSAFQTAKLLKGDRDGFFMGGYRVLYKIASGSFGRVYRADDPRTGVPVAIKELRRRWRDDPHKIDLFEREGKVGLTLRHPNIVQILSVNCDRTMGQYFIVMEFVEGGNLRDILAIRKKLDPKESIRIIEECANALAYAYTRRLTHRDMKPSNILLSSQGVAKLVDFGLAEIARGAGLHFDDAEEEAAVDRTVDYAGLEKATNVPAGDIRSDIFFLGCVLYEMLTGKPALPPTKDRRARMLKQRFEKVAQLSHDEVEAPPSLFHLLERMLAVDPTQRFQTPALLAEATRQLAVELGGGPIADSSAHDGPRTVFVVEKNPKFQDIFREKFKAMGFRVLMSIDASRAVQRYEQQAYDGFVLDLATTGGDGLDALETVQRDARKIGRRCFGIVLLSDEQEPLRRKLNANNEVALLTFPLKKGLLEKTVEELIEANKS